MYLMTSSLDEVLPFDALVVRKFVFPRFFLGERTEIVEIMTEKLLSPGEKRFFGVDRRIFDRFWQAVHRGWRRFSGRG